MAGRGSEFQNQAEELVWRIEAALFEGGSDGAVLGRELSLMERFGVSRATLRQALRILESHGAVRMKPGPSGGVVVTRPSAEFTSRLVALQLRTQGATAQHSIEARGLLERACAERLLGSPRRTSDHFRASDGAPWLLTRIDPLADFAAQVLAHMPVSDSADATCWSSSDEMSLARLSSAVSDGLKRGDAKSVDLAEQRGRLLQRQCAARSNDQIDSGRGSPLARLRALQIAQTILADVDPARCSASTRIGSSFELAERFNTAPSIIAQAVRILQAYGILECQRGRVGGVVLRTPDNAAIARAIQIYLAASDIQSNECDLVWDLLSMQVRLAARKRLWTTDIELCGNRLDRSIGALDVQAAWMGLQGAIAGCMANPVLVAFLGCFGAYRVRKTQEGGFRTLSASEEYCLARHMTRVIEAIGQGDEDGAAAAERYCQQILQGKADHRSRRPHADAPRRLAYSASDVLERAGV